MQRLRLTDPANVRALRAAEARVKAQYAAAPPQKGPSRSPSQPQDVPGQAGGASKPSEQAAPGPADLRAEEVDTAPSQQAEDGGASAKIQGHADGDPSNARSRPGVSGDNDRLAAENASRQEGSGGQQDKARADYCEATTAEPRNLEEQGRTLLQADAMPGLGHKWRQADAKGCSSAALRGRFMRIVLPALREALQVCIDADLLVAINNAVRLAAPSICKQQWQPKPLPTEIWANLVNGDYRVGKAANPIMRAHTLVRTFVRYTASCAVFDMMSWQGPLRAAFLASGCSGCPDLGRLEALLAAAAVAGSAVLSEPNVLQDCQVVALDLSDSAGSLGVGEKSIGSVEGHGLDWQANVLESCRKLCSRMVLMIEDAVQSM